MKKCTCGGNLPCPYDAPSSPVETTGGSERRPDHTGGIRPADEAEALTERQLRYAEAMVLNPQMTVERAAYALLDNVMAVADTEHADLIAEIAELKADHSATFREGMLGIREGTKALLSVGAERDEARRDRDRFARTIEFRVKEIDTARAVIAQRDATIERMGKVGADAIDLLAKERNAANATIERLWAQLNEATNTPHNDPEFGFDKTAALSDPTYEGVFGATPKRGCPCGCSGPTAALSDPGEATP